MGQSRVRKQKLFAEHPNCIFCGGTRPSETVEHCPPRALFQHRVWPDGFEFPCCVQCNSGSSDDDLIVALLARMAPDDSGDLDGKTTGLLKQTQRQHPGLLESMFPGPAEAKRINKALGIRPAPGQTHQDTCVAKVLPRMQRAVESFSAKLSKAIYFKHAGQILPRGSDIAFTWFTSADLVRHGHFPALKALEHITGVAPSLSRNRSLLNDQFQYKWSLSDDLEVFILQALFSNSFGFATFGSVQPDRIGSKLRELDSISGSPGPFSLLAWGDA